MEETMRKDTMADRLQRFLPGRGFLPVNLHAEGMSLYYRTDEGIATLVWIIGDQALTLLDAGQYRAQGETIRSMFLQNGMQTIHMLTLFLSSDITKARAVGEGTPFWIVDEAYGRLVIYENQPEEFAGLKSMIEQNLHFGADIRNENGVQKAGIYAEQPVHPVHKAKYATGYNGSGIRHTGLTGPISFITFALVAINVIVFFFEQKFMDTMVSGGANSWVRVTEDRQVYRLITCMFLHSDNEHIIGNMMTLLFVGSALEERMGHFRYTIMYMMSGLIASLASCFYHMKLGENAYSIGASGAVYGVLGALAFLMFVNRDKRDNSTLIRLIIFGAYMVFRVIEDSGSNIDNAAHIGGFAAGTLFAFLFWLFHKNRRSRYQSRA